MSQAETAWPLEGVPEVDGDPVLALVHRVCALRDVRHEVRRNHNENRWWPTSIEDPHLRMVLAGWSTRVNYNMVASYRRVVAAAGRIGFSGLAQLSDLELSEVVRPIGLVRARIEYFRSVVGFLDRSRRADPRLEEMDADRLIELYAREVRGAGWKVAQCAVLYARGYHCGVVPVDSGMVTYLGPVLDGALPSGPIAHERLRRRIEGSVRRHADEYARLARLHGEPDLDLPTEGGPTWWVHLNLIYFKRLYCNRGKPLHALDRLRAFLETGRLPTAPQISIDSVAP